MSCKTHCYCSRVGSDRPLQVHGHRGARAVRPENTLAAFQYAIAVGADAIEMDVAVTRDGVPVIAHDAHLESLDSRPAIRELSLADVRRMAPDIPTLDEALELAARGAFLFNIEIKSFPGRADLAPAPERFTELVLERIRRHGVARRALVQSFDFRVLHAFAGLAPEIPRAAIFDRPDGDFAAIASRAQAGAVAPEFHLATPANVTCAHQAGLAVFAWTANRPEDWRRLIDARVDAIVTDDPAALLEYLAHLVR